MERLLFVDDDKDLLMVNQAYFKKIGYAVDIALNAEDTLPLLHKQTYDALILDIQMDSINGLELCQYIRKNLSTPIIFLSNLSEEEILEESFNCGGDDFIAKPYRMKELELHIRARIRNNAYRKSSSETLADSATFSLQLRPDEKQAYLHGSSLGLTTNEFQILQFLVSHKGSPFRQEDIYQFLWGEPCYNTHSVQVLILRIRKKIQQIDPTAEYIKTQWGKGYVYTN